MKPPPNHVSLMQIDCEVMNTRLVHVNEDAIPSHMSEQMAKRQQSRGGANGSRNDSSIQRNGSTADSPAFGNQGLEGSSESFSSSTSLPSASIRTGMKGSNSSLKVKKRNAVRKVLAKDSAALSVDESKDRRTPWERSSDTIIVGSV